MQNKYGSSWVIVGVQLILTGMLIFSVSAQAESSPFCKVRRQILEIDNQNVYVVTDRARSLYMISRDLYGDEKKWREIARWNSLSAPYRLESGQTLVINTAPTLSEQEGNKALIKAWTDVNDIEMVHRISGYQMQSNINCGTVVVAPVQAKVPAEAPAKVPAEVSPKFTPPRFPEDEEEVVEDHVEASNDKAHKAGGHWGFSANLIGSQFKINSKELHEPVDNTLYSKLNYGLELSALYHLDEKTEAFFTAGIERVAFEPADGAVIDNDELNLFKFVLGLDYKFTPSTVLALGTMYVQRPFAHPTTSGVKIDAVYLPEIFLGPRFRLINTTQTGTWLFLEGSYSFATEEKNHDVKPGYGYIAGLRFDYQLPTSTITTTAGYRFLKEDTKTAKEKQEALIFSLGATW